MTVESGRTMYRATRNPQPTPLDAAALKRSGVARGRAMRAARGDRDVRAALAAVATEATETNPPPAA